MSLKVTDFGTDRKPVCNFLLANDTYTYLAPFPSYRGILVKSLLMTWMPLFNSFVRGEPLNS